MVEELDFTHEEGSNKDHSLVMYALSTCGFCKRALGFLKNRDVDFRYLYIDTLAPETKKAVKEQLRERYRIKELWPTLVIDGSEALSGFDSETWAQRLGLE